MNSDLGSSSLDPVRARKRVAVDLDPDHYEWPIQERRLRGPCARKLASESF
jgi:hypothetical protein